MIRCKTKEFADFLPEMRYYFTSDFKFTNLFFYLYFKKLYYL